eukprot:TRINITY_DN1331_c0_g1_i3.p1 TRINITY_DN1331_c0_g1~~TRINITY_DN1331_c0_g1_i3.p1  ORF type:complete len:303 (-),score=50.26 TRINITY_DN1331_c0_g1_i3:127-1035(-)
MARVVAAFVGCNAVLFSITQTFYNCCWVAGASMRPTLNPSPHAKNNYSLCLISRFKYRPERGDVVNAHSPTHAGRKIVKRVIGLEGDFVYNRISREIVKVPPGHVWLEGDNERSSHDSNHYGPVPINLVIGQVTRVIVPQSKEDSAFSEVVSHDRPYRRAPMEHYYEQEQARKKRERMFADYEKAVDDTKKFVTDKHLEVKSYLEALRASESMQEAISVACAGANKILFSEFENCDWDEELLSPCLLPESNGATSKSTYTSSPPSTSPPHLVPGGAAPSQLFQSSELNPVHVEHEHNRESEL